MTNKINWDEPYGEIHGTIEEMPEARFTQGDNFYRTNGDLISSGLVDYTAWVQEQKGMTGRNALVSKAKELGIEVGKKDKIDTIKEKLLNQL
jgi:phosphohistidine swiveling domain-containing protein|tara:strand:+ start:221 stop:496 length:276 start_codon:yes stop_codon:yes gene_type:complete